jgi:AcrR family transcriptional regulator
MRDEAGEGGEAGNGPEAGKRDEAGKGARIGAAPRRNIRSPETRRAQLIEAAEALFVEEGLESVTISQITTRAGLAKGTFYLYFDSREALLQALRIRVIEAALQSLAGLTSPESADEWPAFVDRLVARVVDFFAEYREIHELLSSEPHEHQPGEGPRFAALVEWFETTIAAGKAAGATVGDAAITAPILLEMLHTAGHLANTPGVDRERVRLEVSRIAGAMLLAADQRRRMPE